MSEASSQGNLFCFGLGFSSQALALGLLLALFFPLFFPLFRFCDPFLDRAFRVLPSGLKGGVELGMLDRLAESSRGQRRLLDDVRHELKTPITIVRGHLELLDPGRADDVEATRALAIDELDRMAELVDALATLEEVSRDAITAAPVDVDALTRDVHAKVSVIPGHEWVLDAAASGIALLDRARLTQAWLQLADNAAKYAPAGTDIGVGSAVIGDELELWVRDRGPGIPDGFESRIFERFGRADTGSAQGFGLGLPIVQAIAHAHGGRVVVQSSPAGSRFALLIPLVLAGATERTLP